MQDTHQQAVLGAIVNVASIETLEVLCRGSNSAYSLRALAARLRRGAAETREALEALVGSGVARRWVSGEGEALYSLSSSAWAWAFARSFVERFGYDSAYSRPFIAALVRNTGKRALRLAAA